MITIKVGNLTLESTREKMWSINKIWRNERGICTQWSLAQTTVLMIDGKWAGGPHGNAELVNASIFVDGQEKPLVDGSTYVGKTVVLSRETIIAEAYQLKSITTISLDRIDVIVTLQGLDETKYCDICYGIQGSRDNRFVNYKAFGADGTELHSGTTPYTGDPNDIEHKDKLYYLTGAVAVMQYDPIAEEGVLSVCTEGRDSGLEYFLWDRDIDNKLYARFHDVTGPCSPQNLFKFGQSTIFLPPSSPPPPAPPPPSISWLPILGVAGIVGLVGLIVLLKR